MVHRALKPHARHHVAHWTVWSSSSFPLLNSWCWAVVCILLLTSVQLSLEDLAHFGAAKPRADITLAH